MWRRITVPAWRAALTMTLTTGLCMLVGVRWIGKENRSGPGPGGARIPVRRQGRHAWTSRYAGPPPINYRDELHRPPAPPAHRARGHATPRQHRLGRARDEDHGP